jgi:hypothetical protein
MPNTALHYRLPPSLSSGELSPAKYFFTDNSHRDIEKRGIEDIIRSHEVLLNINSWIFCREWSNDDMAKVDFIPLKKGFDLGFDMIMVHPLENNRPFQIHDSI